ncbi:MAG: Asp-tRNA(Asn)/Glu-tRNA(Gln) amidotransferase subunit GatB [Firmicutes bacterium]|nr:Asp-tRNA(Asn)/Glu-tRNA(Gln) amidotransferase subunit GatB [Bacillota bacterium]
MAWETVIGLELHVELNTESKLFCACPARFGAAANTQVCPVCLGLPGALPVLNGSAVDKALIAALALNCEINSESSFSRKNYFYPDLPKGYQITQHETPLARGGWVELADGRRINITRLHLEEDAGKSQHTATETLLDFNRSGIPLVEIVSEPELVRPGEARMYVEAIRDILRYCQVSECRMEAGELRCDANISLRPTGSEGFGEKTELKNLNSLRALERALNYEIGRQRQLLASGKQISRETRRWDENRYCTVPMRDKEQASDYRYFPEPDLPPLQITQTMLNTAKAQVPELPGARASRFQEQYGLGAYDADLLISERYRADWFEAVLEFGVNPKAVANWLLGEVARHQNKTCQSLSELRITPRDLGELIQLEQSGVISGNIARQVLKEMLSHGGSPAEIVQARGWSQVSDQTELAHLVAKTLADNPQSVADYRGGKDRALGFLVGQVMKASSGRANPRLVKQLLTEKLGGTQKG